MPIFLIFAAIIILAVTAKGVADGEVAMFSNAAPRFRAEKETCPRAYWCIILFNVGISLALAVGGIHRLLVDGS